MDEGLLSRSEPLPQLYTFCKRITSSVQFARFMWFVGERLDLSCVELCAGVSAFANFSPSPKLVFNYIFFFLPCILIALLVPLVLLSSMSYSTLNKCRAPIAARPRPR